jgi:Transglycosylase SLT domain
MVQLLTAYYIAFALSCWPNIVHRPRQNREMRAIAAEVASTDATPFEGRRLMNIAALESNFDRTAKGKMGEMGAWQIMPPFKSYGAKEALRRMRGQGMVGYVGCRHAEDEVVLNGIKTTCQAIIDHRVDKADLYGWVFPPPTVPANDTERLVAGNP